MLPRLSLLRLRRRSHSPPTRQAGIARKRTEPTATIGTGASSKLCVPDHSLRHSRGDGVVVEHHPRHRLWVLQSRGRRLRRHRRRCGGLLRHHQHCNGWSCRGARWRRRAEAVLKQVAHAAFGSTEAVHAPHGQRHRLGVVLEFQKDFSRVPACRYACCRGRCSGGTSATHDAAVGERNPRLSSLPRTNGKQVGWKKVKGT